MQPPNTNNRKNIAVSISRIKKEKYLTKKAQAVKKKAIKY